MQGKEGKFCRSPLLCFSTHILKAWRHQFVQAHFADLWLSQYLSQWFQVRCWTPGPHSQDCLMIWSFPLAGQPMNPSFALTLAVSNVTCVVVFGHRFSSDNETFHQLLEAMEVIFKFGGSFLHYVSKPFCFFDLPLPQEPGCWGCQKSWEKEVLAKSGCPWLVEGKA